jgi:hypothetical protein
MAKVDKSVLQFGCESRVRDDTYRRSAKDRACENCGNPDAVGAHPRTGQTGGGGLKPGDDLLLFLCTPCHLGPRGQEHGGSRWLARFTLLRILKLSWPEIEPTDATCVFVCTHILYPILRKRYAAWVTKQ